MESFFRGDTSSSLAISYMAWVSHLLQIDSKYQNIEVGFVNLNFRLLKLHIGDIRYLTPPGERAPRKIILRKISNSRTLQKMKIFDM